MTEPHRSDGPVPGPGARTAVPPPVPSGEELSSGEQLSAALVRLEELGALPVHDHVAVFEEVDRSLRRRLATAEG